MTRPTKTTRQPGTTLRSKASRRSSEATRTKRSRAARSSSSARRTTPRAATVRPKLPTPPSSMVSTWAWWKADAHYKRALTFSGAAPKTRRERTSSSSIRSFPREPASFRTGAVAVTATADDVVSLGIHVTAGAHCCGGGATEEGTRNREGAGRGPHAKSEATGGRQDDAVGCDRGGGRVAAVSRGGDSSAVVWRHGVAWTTYTRSALVTGQLSSVKVSPGRRHRRSRRAEVLRQRVCDEPWGIPVAAEPHARTRVAHGGRCLRMLPQTVPRSSV